MIEIHAQFGQAPHYDLNMLGRAGEHGTRQIVFDCADALREYPNARIICAVLRPRDTTPYPAELTGAGDTRILTLTRVETYLPGLLKLELRAVDGERVLKSALYAGRITESLQGDGDKPGNPLSDALNRLESTIADAQTLADEIRQKLDNGEFVGERGPQGEKGDKGEKGEQGEKGEPGERGANGADAPQIDDNAVSANTPWSSQRIVNTLCQEAVASGNPVVCTPVKDSPLGIKVSWEPTQTGSGTPSPTNIRPITGRESVALTVNGEARTLALPHTVYGGSVDAVTGDVTEEYALHKSATAKFNTTNIPATASNWVSAYWEWDSLAATWGQKIKFCNALPVTKWDPISVKASIDEPCCWYANASFGVAVPRALLSLSDNANGQEILNAIQGYADELGLEIAYKLATPTHYQITGIDEVTALEGTNTISTDADQAKVTWREAARIRDVQANGTSIVANGVANIPKAEPGKLGLTSCYNPWVGGLYVGTDGIMRIVQAPTTDIDTRATAPRPITGNNLDYAVKAAMCDGKGAAWTNAEQTAARERIGVGKPYELIEEFTFTEDTARFERSAEPNGTDYSFTAMRVLILCMPTDRTGINALLYMGDSNHPEYIYFYTSITDSSAAKSNNACCDAALRGSRWHALQNKNSGGSGIANNGSWTSVISMTEPSKRFALTASDMPLITTLKIIPYTGEKVIPAGSIIRIYGVRA